MRTSLAPHMRGFHSALSIWLQWRLSLCYWFRHHHEYQCSDHKYRKHHSKSGNDYSRIGHDQRSGSM